MDTGVKKKIVAFLTFVRFPLVFAFFAGAIVYVNYREMWLFVTLFSALVASAVTDLLDGFYARRWKVETRFGAYADPLMDKIFYIATLPLLVFVAMKNAHVTHATFLLIMTAMFLARDQWVSFLRSIGSMYNVSGKASWTGKVRTCVNFPLICCIYHFEEAETQIVNAILLYTFEGIAFVLTLISMVSYTIDYWPYLRKSSEEK